MDSLLSAFGINGKLLLAQLINFGVLFAGLSYLLYRPVMKMLDERSEKIALGVKSAEEATAKAAQADTDAKATVHIASQEAEGIVALARESAQSEKNRILKEAETRAQALEADAQARATEDAARALRDSEKEIARLAVLAAEKVLSAK